MCTGELFISREFAPAWRRAAYRGRDDRDGAACIVKAPTLSNKAVNVAGGILGSVNCRRVRDDWLASRRSPIHQSNFALGARVSLCNERAAEGNHSGSRSKMGSNVALDARDRNERAYEGTAVGPREYACSSGSEAYSQLTRRSPRLRHRTDFPSRSGGARGLPRRGGDSPCASPELGSALQHTQLAASGLTRPTRVRVNQLGSWHLHSHEAIRGSARFEIDHSVRPDAT